MAVEGLTILRVHELITWHVFVGMLIVPFVIVKTATTLYRFARYYAGNPEYVRKGAPRIGLRVLGPVVVAATLTLFATGIAALAAGPSTRWLVELHKVIFIGWFGAMTVHVLGHIVETPALACADWRRHERSRLPGRSRRITVLVAAAVTGLVLATLSLVWIGAWHHVSAHG